MTHLFRATAHPLIALGVVSTLLALLLTVATLAEMREGRELHAAGEAELQSVAELQVARLTHWRKEREADVRVLLETPSLGEVLRAVAGGGRDEETARLVELWRRMARHLGYAEVRFVDPRGETLLSSGDGAEIPELAQHVAAAIETGGFVWTDIHAHGGAPHLELVAAALGSDGRAVGAVVLVMDPGEVLFPALASWPRPSRTGETLLVQRVGAVVELRPPGSGGLATSLPLSRADAVAVQAVQGGGAGMVRGQSHEGTDTTAAVRPIPGTPWVLVAQMADDEVFAPARSHHRAAIALGVVTALATALAASVWWGRAKRKLHEEQRLTELKFQSALEAARLGVLVFDAKGYVVQHNRPAATLLAAPGSLVGRPITDFNGPDTAPEAARRLAELQRGDRDHFVDEKRLVRADGVRVDMCVRATAVRDAARALQLIVVILEDVTEQRRLQEQVGLSERMSSLGTLAAGIAHEINNPLSFVLANVRFASDGLRELAAAPDELRAALGDATEGARRVQEIVRDLKTFARGEPRGGTTEDLGAVVRSAVTLAQNEIKYRARLRLDLPRLPPASGAPHRLGQVFLNLLVNAAQALPEGRVDEHEISVRAGADEDRVWIEVADDGAGVPPELRQRIFDPFFTTKPAGVGTGLGLSICHAIVTDAGGTLALVPSGRGAVFRVELPVARLDAATPPTTRGPEPRARILVVDDEPQVGKALERLLGAYHEVAYVGNARDALALLEEGRPYDVVLCDLMMPDLTGMDFYEELARRDPLLAERVAFITGGAFTPRAREFLERNRNERLDKPFDPEALREVVSRLAASA